MRLPGRQGGVALITVLLVFFLVTVVATEIVGRVNFGIRHTGNQLIAAQAYQYALGGEAFARQLLYRDFERDQQEGSGDHLGEAWANLAQQYAFDQGVLEIRIEDLQGRLNVNNLANLDGEAALKMGAVFKRLLGNEIAGGELIAAWQDWIDGDINPRTVGTEDEGYLALEHPYRAANRPLAELSELLLTKGMEWPLFEKLEPYLTALPPGTAVNLNTSSTEVLMALLPEIDRAGAERIIAGRGEQGYPSVQALLEHEATAGLTPNPGDFTVRSEYFAVTVRSLFAGREVWLRSVLHRDPEQGTIRLLYRDRRPEIETASQPSQKTS